VSAGSIVAATLQYSGVEPAGAISVADVMRAPAICAPDKASQPSGVRTAVGLGVGVDVSVLEAVAVGVRLGGGNVLVALTVAVLVTTRNGGVFGAGSEPPPQAASTTASIATEILMVSRKPTTKDTTFTKRNFLVVLVPLGAPGKAWPIS
jgi:hypothetical protein